MFCSGGPGISGDLDKGLDLVGEYTDKVLDAQKRKAELVNAQTLFGLEITPFPGLNWVDTDLRKLTQIYGLYQVSHETQVQANEYPLT